MNMRVWSCFVFVSALAGCSGKTIDAGTNGVVGTVSLDSLDLNETIATLSDAQAGQVCDWLYASYPGFKTPLDGSPPPQNGLESASAFACEDGAIGWPNLTPEYCVLNLRHSPCEATLASLQRCVQFLLPMYMTGIACSDVQAECGAFLDAPSCSQTVFQTGCGVQSGLPVTADAAICDAGAG
jgi:hypothetical protein